MSILPLFVHIVIPRYLTNEVDGSLKQLWENEFGQDLAGIDVSFSPTIVPPLGLKGGSTAYILLFMLQYDYNICIAARFNNT